AVLVGALNTRMPKEALVKIAELIGLFAPKEDKQKAAAQLVAMEAEMRSRAFSDWIKAKIREELGKAGSKDEKRVVEGTKITQDRLINEGVLPAMKYLADQPIVADRLLAIASDASLGTERRQRALLALKGNVREAHLNKILELALSNSTPPEVRDEAFDRIGG